MLLLSAVVSPALAGGYRILNETSSFLYTSIVVKYASVSADMTSTDSVSGVITIPSNNKANFILLDNHHTIASNSEAPSEMGTTAGGKLLSMAYCIVATDYVGYGVTKDQRHPYLCSRQNAQNAIDLALIAREIIDARGVQLSYNNLVNVGYSQGGAVAMAVHRELENNHELASRLHFAGTWCGDGPYDIRATMTDYLEHPDSVAYPLAFPLVVNGFLSGAPAELKEGLTFSDFFTQEMLDAGLEGWISDKNLDNDTINNRMRAVVGNRDLTVRDIFKEEMASPNGVLAQKYLEFADADCICTGWTPTYPIKLIHLENDNVVPVVNAYNAQEGLGLPDSQCVIDYSKGYDHAGYGMHFYLNLVNEFINFDFDHPTALPGTLDQKDAARPALRLEDGRLIIEHSGHRYDVTGRQVR